jgi:hypothetical protein
MPVTVEQVYEVGDAPVITATITNLAGTAADPTTVTFNLRAFSETESTSYVYGTDAEVTKTGTGVYVFAVPQLTSSGRRFVHLLGEGAVEVGGQTRFDVLIQEAPPAA